MKSISREIEVTPTPEECAICFSNMNGDEQAAFFNALAEDWATWECGFCMRLQWVTEDPRLTDAARVIMRQIGEYSEKSKP